jgi:hypothetical protein
MVNPLFILCLVTLDWNASGCRSTFVSRERREKTNGFCGGFGGTSLGGERGGKGGGMLPPLFLRRGGMSCVSSARESESASWISEDEFGVEVGDFCARMI